MKKVLLTGITSVTLAAVPVAQSYACSNNGHFGGKHTNVHINQHINTHVKVTGPKHDQDRDDQDRDKHDCEHGKKQAVPPTVNGPTTLQGGKGAGPVPQPTPVVTPAVATTPAQVVADPAVITTTPSGAVNAGAGVQTSKFAVAPLAGLLGSTSILGLGVRRLLKAGR